jgi:hypothetical protein
VDLHSSGARQGKMERRMCMRSEHARWLNPVVKPSLRRLKGNTDDRSEHQLLPAMPVGGHCGTNAEIDSGRLRAAPEQETAPAGN